MLNRVGRRLGGALQFLINGQASGRSLQEIPAITAEEVAEARSFFPLEKFFIFGHARSGTTLLVRLIRLHPQVHCNYQAHFFTRPPLLQSLVADAEVQSWLSRRSNRWNRGRNLSPVVLRAVADFILERDARKEGKSIVGDKSPSSLLNGQAVRLMHDVYPDARLIYIVRDGRDTVVSHRFQSFIDATQHLSPEDMRIREAFIREPDAFLRGERSIFTEEAIRWGAGGWARNLNETRQAAQELYPGQYHFVRYDHLVERPYPEMEQVWSFLGADAQWEGLDRALKGELERNPDADWQKEKAGALVEPLEKGKQGSWKTLFTERDRQVFKSIAGDMLIDWGFESGLDW
jgi:hypothetical protein